MNLHGHEEKLIQVEIRRRYGKMLKILMKNQELKRLLNTIQEYCNHIYTMTNSQVNQVIFQNKKNKKKKKILTKLHHLKNLRFQIINFKFKVCKVQIMVVFQNKRKYNYFTNN